MINFVEELSKCREEGTMIPYFPEWVEGYTEQELAVISKKCNIEITGQFREFLLQMGKCSGGLLWGDDFPMYDHRWKPVNFENFQSNERNDENYISCPSSKDPVKNKIFYLYTENELTFFYYLFTNDRDDYIWGYYEDENRCVEKTQTLLLDQLKYYVRTSTKNGKYIDFNMTEEQIKDNITGRLL
ncbi:SMI1/KNR4 family protein [Acinetobacter modestus]|uniref:SMI1/KNR4 family protein n=1 Tax=Acinetobacter modestus TaxID=1776740 RepID=UPI00320B6D9A